MATTTTTASPSSGTDGQRMSKEPASATATTPLPDRALPARPTPCAATRTHPTRPNRPPAGGRPTRRNDPKLPISLPTVPRCDQGRTRRSSETRHALPRPPSESRASYSILGNMPPSLHTRRAQSSERMRLRSFLVFDDSALPCSRRSFDARVGRVGRRGFGSTSASLIISTSRPTASARFCSSDL